MQQRTLNSNAFFPNPNQDFVKKFQEQNLYHRLKLQRTLHKKNNSLVKAHEPKKIPEHKPLKVNIPKRTIEKRSSI